jgi:hypothetical protein
MRAGIVRGAIGWVAVPVPISHIFLGGGWARLATLAFLHLPMAWSSEAGTGVGSLRSTIPFNMVHVTPTESA